MMSFARHTIILLAFIMTMVGQVNAQYFKASTAPDPMSFLPERYPDENNPYWAHDMYRHFAIKKYRDSAYVADMKLANYDYVRVSETNLQNYYANNHVKFFQPAFGLTVNKTTNKEIFFFLDSCRQSSNQMLSLIPDSCYRTRPCVRLREANFGDIRTASSHYYNYTYAPNNSFPSNEGTSGWLTGMLMSCLNPWNCDTILSRGWQHGWFRQLSGNMWSSDLNTARALGTVAFTRLMSLPHFRSRLRAMQQKTRTVLLSPTITPKLTAAPAATIDELLCNDTLMSKIASFIPAIGDESDGAFQADLAYYMSLKPLRDSLFSGDLLGSSYVDILNPIDAFQTLLGVTIDPDLTPSLYQLFMSIEECCGQLCQSVQQRSLMRRRPFDVFGQEPFTLEDSTQLRRQNSYPSLQASVGLGTALLLSMILPNQCDTLIKIGYQYGMNRVISGTSWQSDIDAGRCVSCLALSVVASGSDFLDLLEDAIAEYRDLHDIIITDIPTINPDAHVNETPLYTIDGRRASPHSRGILLGKDKKVFIP